MANEIERLSYSDIRTFHECPYRLWMQKQDKWRDVETDALFIGRYAHALLESKAAGEQFEEENQNIMIGNIGKSNQALKVGYKRIKEAVAEVKATADYQKYGNALRELYLRVNHGDFQLSGRIDALEINDKLGRIDIMDWKTVSNFDTFYDEFYGARVEWYDGYKAQLALYAYLLQQSRTNLSDYTIVGHLLGFTKESPVNMQFYSLDFGTLNSVHENVYVLNVLHELDSIYEYYQEVREDEIEACHKCGCCIANQKYRRVEE